MHPKHRIRCLAAAAVLVASLGAAPTWTTPLARAEICPGVLGPVVVPGPCGPGLLGDLVGDAVSGAVAGAISGAIDVPRPSNDDIADQQRAGLPPCYTPEGQPFYTAAGEPCPAGMDKPPAATPTSTPAPKS